MRSNKLTLLAAALGCANTAFADTTIEAVGRLTDATMTTGAWAGARAGEYVHVKYDVNDTPQTVPSPGHAAIYATRLPTFFETMRGVSVGLNLASAFTPTTTFANNFPGADALVLSDTGETAAHLIGGTMEFFEVHNGDGGAWGSEDIVTSRGVYPAALFASAADWGGSSGNGFYSVQLETLVIRSTTEPTGACCPGDGWCMTTSQAACPGAGLWTSGGSCSPNPCAPAGACCLPSGGCGLTPQATCAAIAGAIYNGNNTACTANGCPSIGACCIGGSCVMLIQSACEASEGSWLGQFVTCAILPEFATIYQHTPPQPGDSLLPILDAQFISGNPGTNIPRTTVATLTVTDPTVIQTLEVWVGMFHARLADIKLELTGPNGTTVQLLNRFGTINNCTTMPVGPGHSMDGNFVFQDSAPFSIHEYLTSLPTSARAQGGRYRPSSCGGGVVTLDAPSPAGFGGIPLAGTWTLSITDSLSGQAGNLGVFGLSINGGNPEPCALGACCTGSVCAIRGFAECAAGSWLPTATCEPNPCAPQTGACCCGAHCSVTTATACAGGNMRFAGAGTACIPFASATPCCRGDYNKNTVGASISVQDIFDFLTGYFSNDPCADTNDSAAISVQDIFDFLSAYFGGGC